MGNYKARRPGFIEAWKILAAEYMFQGKPDKEIAELLWPVLTTMPKEEAAKKMQSYKRRLRELRKDSAFQEYYKSMITEWRVHTMGPALAKLKEQINSPEPWLANKAANDVLTRVGADPFTNGEESSAVTIRFEGMPELGSPDDEAD